MQTFISILRGINVSGHKIIKMDALKKSYESVGFQNVKTYVQSGNIVFRADESDTGKLEDQITGLIRKDFELDVPVIILTIDKLKKVIESNPFLHDPEKDIACLHVSFLASVPENYDAKSIEDKKQTGEEIRISENAIYLYCPNGYGRTKLNNNFLESKLKVCATTRNWKTTNELLKIAEGIN